MELLKNNKKLIISILITAIVFVRCDLGIVKNSYVMYLNVLVDGLAILYCIYLFLEDRELTLKALLNPAILWLVVFGGLMFAYGHFGFRTAANYFSRQYMLLTMVPPVLILIMLWHLQDEILSILTRVSCVIIPAFFITVPLYDPDIHDWAMGEFSRIGQTPAGTSIDTGRLYLLMMIPVLYQVIIKREFKKYSWAVIMAVVGILLTGSKSALFPVVFVFAIMVLGSSADRQTLYKRLGLVAVLAVVGLILCMKIPFLYDIIGNRIEELFFGVQTTEYDLHNSTGQRMAVIAAFKEHFWETPILGHGWYSFKEMPYSQLEEYKENGVVMYRNIQIHMNYFELLFDMGILGFIAYYWFPVKLVIDSVLTHDKEAKLLGLSYLTAFFFIDLGLDMYYKYMTPYFVYLVVYILIRRSKKA